MFLLILCDLQLVVLNFPLLILLLNLFSLGYGLENYVNYIFNNSQIYVIVVGIIILMFSVIGGYKNELYIWYCVKF